jgi:hypothetical protein
VSDGVSREGGGVVRDTNDNRTAVGERLVDTVGDGHADGVGTEVVIIDGPGLAIPTGAGVFEVADQFALFSIDADDGQARRSKPVRSAEMTSNCWLRSTLTPVAKVL